MSSFFYDSESNMSINIQIIATLENSFEVPQEIKYRITMCPSNSILRYLLKKTTELDTLK